MENQIKDDKEETYSRKARKIKISHNPC